MNTMINNPKRTIVLNKSADFIFTRLQYIGAWSGDEKGITIVQANLDKNLNLYNFMSKANISGIVDFGNKGSVTVIPKSDDSCELTIEIGKNYGCISDQYEAQDCENQVDAFLRLLSETINMSDEELKNFPKDEGKNKKKKSKLWYWVIGIILFFTFLV